MKKLLLLLLLCLVVDGFAQDAVELTPGGFETVIFEKPDRPIDKLMERAKGWAPYYNRNTDYSFDVYDVTENSLSIDAYKPNAFFYRNRAEIYYHRIRYTMKIEFGADIYKVSFSIKEIYSDNTLTKLTTADFFAPDGRLKEDYEEVKPSLETSVNNTISSFGTFMAAD